MLAFDKKGNPDCFRAERLKRDAEEAGLFHEIIGVVLSLVFVIASENIQF